MECNANTKKGTKCKHPDVRRYTVPGTGAKLDLCSTHIKMVESGREVDFWVTPTLPAIPKNSSEGQDTLPGVAVAADITTAREVLGQAKEGEVKVDFKKDRNTEILEEQQRREQLAELERQSRALNLQAEKGEGVYPPELNIIVTPDGEKDIFVISWSGHRPDKLGGYNPNPIRAAVKSAMKKRVLAIMERYGDVYEYVIVWGGALGVDQWAAALANHLGLRHVCVVPWEGFYSVWRQDSIRDFVELCATTDEDLAGYIQMALHGKYNTLDIVSDGILCLNNAMDKSMNMRYQDRNVVMADAATMSVVVWNRTSGGTANYVKYVREQGLKWTLIKADEIITRVRHGQGS